MSNEKKCFVSSCLNENQTESTFFGLPSDCDDREIWIKNLNLDPTIPDVFICSQHFVDGEPTMENPYPVISTVSNSDLENSKAVDQPKTGANEELLSDTDKTNLTRSDSIEDVSNQVPTTHLLTEQCTQNGGPVSDDEPVYPCDEAPTKNLRFSKNFWSIRSFRFALTWVLCLVMLANQWCRSSLSMSMVCMVNATALAISKSGHLANASSQLDTDEFAGCGSLTGDLLVDYGGDIMWTSAQQAILFSAIFWGGAVVSLPGGWMITRYGSKRVVSTCLVITLISNLVTPVAALEGGLVAMFFVRFFMGFGGQVVLNTAITVIMAHWIPPAERSTVLALYTSGNQIAVIAGMPINAALCRNRNFLGGWPAIFYVSGVIVLIALIVFHIFVDDTPAKSRWISQNEREYIEKSLQSQSLDKKKDVIKNMPWRKILTSHVLWSCCATNFAAGLVAATLQSYIPTYYKEALRIDLKSNGFFSAVPFLSQWLSKMVFAVVADAMKKHTRVSHTVICKGFNTIGTIVASAFLVACAYMSCHQLPWAIVFLSLANAAFSGLIPGAMTALVCFAPAYTGLVNALSRFGAQLASIVAPYIVGGVTKEGTPEQWRIVFFIMAGLMTSCGIYFLFTGTVKIQEWAKSENSEVDDSENKDTKLVIPTLSDDNNNKNKELNGGKKQEKPSIDLPKNGAIKKTSKLGLEDDVLHL